MTALSCLTHLLLLNHPSGMPRHREGGSHRVPQHRAVKFLALHTVLMSFTCRADGVRRAAPASAAAVRCAGGRHHRCGGGQDCSVVALGIAMLRAYPQSNSWEACWDL